MLVTMHMISFELTISCQFKSENTRRQITVFSNAIDHITVCKNPFGNIWPPISNPTCPYLANSKIKYVISSLYLFSGFFAMVQL